MRQIHENLWVHEDSMKLGVVDLPLRMTIARLADGKLWMHSPTPLSDELKTEVDGLGEAGAIVAPSNGHNLFVEEWAKACPGATVYVSRGIPGKLPGLTNWVQIGEETSNLWSADFDQKVMGGVPFFDECVFLHRASGSLIVTDFIQNHRNREHSGLDAIVTKLILRPIGFKDICLAPPLRWGFMIKDKAALLDFVREIQSWEFNRIIVTHGEIIEEGAKQTLADLCKRFG